MKNLVHESASPSDQPSVTEQSCSVSRPTGALLKHIYSKKMAEGLWLVGWAFSSRKSGEDTVRALADLYSAFEEREAVTGKRSKDSLMTAPSGATGETPS